MTWLAKQAMTLDHVSDGRFVLAVAPGFWAAESTARGFEHAERGARFDDALDGLAAAFAGQAHDGEFVHVPATLAPGPSTAGGPPIWLAGARATMDRALDRGLPFQASRLSPDDLAPLARRWWDGGGGLLGVRIRIGLDRVASRADGVEWQALTGPADFLAAELARYADLRVADVSLIPGQDDRSSARHRRGIDRARGPGSHRRGPARLRAIDRAWHHEDLSAGRAWSASCGESVVVKPSPLATRLM